MRLGVFQADCGGLGLDERLSRLEGALKGQTLDLVVCPELFATGYHLENGHGALAEPSDGRYLDAFSALAKRHEIAIAFGYPEAADRTYNAAAVVSADGTLLANHRKRLASPGSFEEHSFANGNAPTHFDLAGLRIAVAICYEIEFPETARGAALSGAALLIVPTALVAQWPVVAERIVPARAFENGLWLAYANHSGSELMHEYLGGSRIVAPDGDEVAIAGRSEEMLMAEIDAKAVAKARMRLPYLRDCAAL
jgi:predicted amidohydrolase